MMPRSIASVVVATAGIAIGTSLMAHAASPKSHLKDVHVVVPQNSIDAIVYLEGRDVGLFRKHDINLTVDPRPFVGFLAGIPSKQSMVGNYSGLAAIKKINNGIPWAIIGPGLNVINGVIVRKNSPFKTITDLRGKPFGAHSTSAGSFLAARAAILAADKFDIVKDTKLEQFAAPALYKLLEDKSLDAMVSISSFTLRALSQPAKFRMLFSPTDYWTKRTGYPLDWASPLVAWRSWVVQDPARARDFVEATEESYRWLRNPHHFDMAVKKYGKLAGVTTQAQVETYNKLFAAKKVFLTHWNRKVANAEWKFLALAKAQGILKKVPSESKYALLVGKVE